MPLPCYVKVCAFLMSAARRLADLDRGKVDMVGWLGLPTLPELPTWKEVLSAAQQKHPDIMERCAHPARLHDDAPAIQA